jgi:acyl carrier protein
LDKNALKENKVVTLPETADESVKKHLIGCGKPRREEHGIDLRIVDIESRAELAEDQIGEVWVNSPSKAGGYFGQEDTSAEAFNAALSSSLEGKDGAEDGTTYLRTGDLGFLHNGELFICGRDKDLIIIRGGNHYPQDIEQVVESDDRVRPGCSAAFSVTVDDEEVLVVVAELRNAKDSAVQEIARDARQRATPEHGDQVHTLVMIKPRTAEKTSSGKIARRWARKAYLAGSLNVVLKSSGGGLGRKAAAGIGAKTKTPKKKAANGGGSNKERFLDEVSNLTEIDPDDLALDVPLQEMGLDSMVIEQMRGMISGEFGVEIEVEELFDEECTLSKIIRKIDGDDDVGTPKKDGDAVVVPIDGDNSGASRAANAKKKAPSTFEVIFCFCCRGNKNGTKQ